MSAQPLLLSDSQMQSFIVNGYVTVKADFPPEFHRSIFRQADAIFQESGNPGNEIYPAIPEIGAIFGHPAVDGALSSVLGAGYIMHPHRHCHLTPPHQIAQGDHQDSYEHDEPVRHHHTRWAMAFYYPQDVSLDMGPTALRPATQYYLDEDEAKAHDEIMLSGEAGTVTIVHYDVWHRASTNNSVTNRFMMKFLFCRMAEPEGPSWAAKDQAWNWETAAMSSDHTELWKHQWAWFQGRPDEGHEKDGSIHEAIQAVENGSEAQRLNGVYRLAGLGEEGLAGLLQLWENEANEQLDKNLAMAYTNPSQLVSGLGLAAVGRPALAPLLDALQDRRWWIRAGAADILGDMGRAAADGVSALAEALEDESPWVRRNGAEALGNIGQRSVAASGALAHALINDSTNYVRHNAAGALARIGPAARHYRPALTKALDDPDLYVRGNAAIGLQRMVG